MNARLQQKSGADLRKLQLVDIASDLICSEGVDALRHSTLAELAGCTRALVYRYFPKKTDIYVAISESFYAELDELISVEEQQRAVGKSSQGSADSRRFFSILFEVLDRRGLAALLLNNSPALNNELEAYTSIIKQKFEQRWVDAFEPRKIKGIQAELIMSNCTSVVTNYYRFYAQGKIARDAALDQIERIVYTLIETGGGL